MAVGPPLSAATMPGNFDECFASESMYRYSIRGLSVSRSMAEYLEKEDE